MVIAGGKRELPSWIGARQIEAAAQACRSRSFPVMPTRNAGAPLRVRVPEANRVECQPGCAAVLGRKQATYVAQRWMGPDEESRVVVLADDFLFRNASLLVADNAAALDAPAARRWHGHRARR